MQILDLSPIEIVSLPPEYEGEMEGQSNRERFAEIEDRLKNIEIALELKPPKPPIPQKTSWAHKYEWAINHKGTALIWALILCVVGIIGGGLFKYHLDHKDDSFNEAVDKRVDGKLSPTTAKLSELGERMARVEGKLDVLIIRSAAAQPSNQQNTQLVKDVLAAANVRGEKLDPAIIADAGTKFIDAANKSPNAWNAALTLVNYRSSLNIYSRAVQGVAVPANASVVFSVRRVPGKSLPTMFDLPTPVDVSDSARYEDIGENLNQQLKFGTAQLILKGGATSLDGKYLKHVIFDSVEIHYSGKPLNLQDVIFFNCTFVFDNTQPARSLGQAILASSPVNFQTAG